MQAEFLTQAQRADLRTQIVAALFERDWTDIDIILTSFDLDGLGLESEPDYQTARRQCRSSLQAADDTTLRDLATYLLGSGEGLMEPHMPTVDGADGIWGAGIARVFLSHLARQKAFVGEVSRELSAIQLRTFVAHDTIDVSQEWQLEIERALQSADVLVGLAHPGFHSSVWTQQEVGWALGRNLPVLIIGLGEKPEGFPNRYQSPMLNEHSAWKVASTVAVWMTRYERWRDRVVEELVNDLKRANSYVAGRDAANRLAELGKLTPAVLDGIELAYLSNDQLYPYHVGAVVIERILVQHGRTLPRDKPFMGEKRK